jgi:hypothetical protein
VNPGHSGIQIHAGVRPAQNGVRLDDLHTSGDPTIPSHVIQLRLRGLQSTVALGHPHIPVEQHPAGIPVLNPAGLCVDRQFFRLQVDRMREGRPSIGSGAIGRQTAPLPLVQRLPRKPEIPGQSRTIVSILLRRLRLYWLRCVVRDGLCRNPHGRKNAHSYSQDNQEHALDMPEPLNHGARSYLIVARAAAPRTARSAAATIRP